MKKQKLNSLVTSLLLQIHRGFLTKEESDSLSDSEILANVPENKGTFLSRKDDSRESRVSPFTYRWVKQRVKVDPTVTAEELLKSAGFR